MYECRHFFEDDCERMPTSIAVRQSLFVHAHDAVENSLSVTCQSFEHLGSPPATANFLDSSAVKVEKLGRNVSVPGPDDSWMDGLSAADTIRQYGF